MKKDILKETDRLLAKISQLTTREAVDRIFRLNDDDLDLQRFIDSKSPDYVGLWYNFMIARPLVCTCRPCDKCDIKECMCDCEGLYIKRINIFEPGRGTYMDVARRFQSSLEEENGQVYCSQCGFYYERDNPCLMH